MTSTFRSLFARTYMKAALVLAPMIFIGAECDPTGPANTPLAMDAMRAEVTVDGSFVCDAVSGTGSESAKTITLIAQGDNTVGSRRIELVIPKQSVVPYTINVSSSDQAVIYYCIPLTSSACKNFFADKAHGGSGTITVTHIDGYVEGSFQGTVKLSNGDETRTITSGEFKANY
jgi:hypothetical protein